MQRAPANDSNSIFDRIVPPISPASPTQHGLDAVLLAVPGDAHHAEQQQQQQQQPCQSGESSSAAADGTGGSSSVDVQALDAELRQLSVKATTSTSSPGKTTTSSSSSRKGKGPLDALASAGTVSVAGQRIAEYEQAWTPSPRKRDTGKKPMGTSASVTLDALPNEILTHIFSYLHPGSHDAVALVSKRMYALITTPHAWHMAFLRFFPGHDDDDWAPAAPAPTRLFSRLTLLASWRSEYLLRTGLLRSLTSGKPGLSVGARHGGGGGGGSSKKKTTARSKHATAVITYDSQLPGVVDRLHAVFTASGKKTARAVHGFSPRGAATSSKPAFGRLEAWGLRDDYLARDVAAVAAAAARFGGPPLPLYGMGDDHRTAVPNALDVSHVFGVLVGEGMPGGHLLYRSMEAPSFQFLDAPGRAAERPGDWPTDVPFVPSWLEPSFCAVWLAKTPAVPTVTKGMISMLAGSSLGIVSAYSPGRADVEASQQQQQQQQHQHAAYTKHSVATAHWAVCPGVPIVALVADDSYTEKRRAARRVWAVAVNALGEVYCLRDTPTATATTATAQLWQQPHGLAQEHVAWRAGRTAVWTLVEATRRTVTADLFDSSAERLKRATSPSPVLSPTSATTEGERVAEVQAVEAFFHLRPSDFRAVYDVWDMRLKLEVDFAGGHVSSSSSSSNGAEATAENVFVIACGSTLPGERKPQPAGVTRYTRLVGGDGDGNGVWQKTVYALPGKKQPEITCSAIDLSLPALVAPWEDPLLQDDNASVGEVGIPGQRSRWLAVGTATGSVVVWNMREAAAATVVAPLRVIQTASRAIASVAVSSLYVVHGGSDGLVQAWDPLGSSRAAMRTLHAPATGRIPRQLAHLRRELSGTQFAAVGAIYLDPDPTVLRGVLSLGSLVRHWSYSASSLRRRHNNSNGDGNDDDDDDDDHGRRNARKRQRRVRYANAEGQRVSRRLGDQTADFIAATTAQLEQDAVQAAREEARLLQRFGVGLAGLTEDEAVRYAEILSTEAFMGSGSGSGGSGGDGSGGSGGDGGGTGSAGSLSTDSTVTREPSPSQQQQPGGEDDDDDDDEDDFELQTQRAIRLSLMESGGGGGEAVAEVASASASAPSSSLSPVPAQQDTDEMTTTTTTTPGLSDLGFPVTYRAARRGGGGGRATTPAAAAVSSEEDDLQLALRLSLQEEEEGVVDMGMGSGSGSGSHTVTDDHHLYAALGDTVDSDAALAALLQEDEFPALQGSPAGKGKGRG